MWIPIIEGVRPAVNLHPCTFGIPEVATRLRGPQAGAAVTYGPCISKQGCDLPAGGKSRLCAAHLDALLDQLGA